MREFLRSVLDDVIGGARGLLTRRGYASVVIGTLTLGIGATTAVFSAVDGALLRQLPYVNASQIVHLGERAAIQPGLGNTTSFENFADWKRLSHSFTSLGIATMTTRTLTGAGRPLRVGMARVSAGIFDVFHVTPFLGRALNPSDEARGATSVVLLGYDFWRSHFGGDPEVIGRTIQLDFDPTEIVGILPPDFRPPEPLAQSLWGNFVSFPSGGRGGRADHVYGLVRPGVTLDQVQTEMTGISARLAELYPDTDGGETAAADPLLDTMVAGLRRPLLILLGASWLLLMIAAANIANLTLTRGIERERELTVRAALGASRRRLVRQLLTETSLLIVIGCMTGTLAAIAGNSALLAIGPAIFHRRPPTLSLAVLMAAIAAAVLTALVVGLGPALRATSRDLQASLRRAKMTGASARLRAGLAVIQLALAVVLLTASGLVLKSFARLMQLDPGIRADHVLTMDVTLPAARYEGARSTIFFDALSRRLRTIPGVVNVAVTSLVPFSGDWDHIFVTHIAGEPELKGGEAATADHYVVSPSYFATLGIRLLHGRLLAAEDQPNTPVVCVVDEIFARRTFTGRDPLGQRMQIPGRDDFATIVGTVSHVRTEGLDVLSPGQIYVSNAQYPWRWSSVIIRTTGDPLAFTRVATDAVQHLDPQQPVDNAASMEQLMADRLRARRFTLATLALFAGVALLLAIGGLYAVISYGVAARAREFGIRAALGATRSRIVGLVTADATRIAIIGAAIGVAGALAGDGLLAGLLFDVSPRDAAVLTGVVGALIAVAVGASVVPAVRAASADPAQVIRLDE